MAAFIAILLVLPVFLGIAGAGMHFVPDPSLRLIASIAALGYGLMLVLVIRKRVRSGEGQVPQTPAGPIALVAGVIMGIYFFYVTVFMPIPAVLTEAFGEPASRDYVIEGITKANRNARGCPYRLSLKDVVTVMDDSFCVSESFSRKHVAGQSIRLTGAETVLGFRFHNVDW